MSTTLRLGPSQTLRVITAGPDELHLESTWLPGPPPRRHWHPRQDERFEMLAGRLTVELGDGAPRVLGVGDELEIPRRTVHRMWNDGVDVATASWRITPPGRTQEMFAWIDAGLSPVRTALMLWRFRYEFRLPPVV